MIIEAFNSVDPQSLKVGDRVRFCESGETFDYVVREGQNGTGLTAGNIRLGDLTTVWKRVYLSRPRAFIEYTPPCPTNIPGAFNSDNPTTLKNHPSIRDARHDEPLEDPFNITNSNSRI